MMRARMLAIGLALASGASFAGCDAQAERLIVSVSNHRVTVTPNYAGEELVLFGSVEKDDRTPPGRGNYDLVVTVSGPRADMVTRRKDVMERFVISGPLHWLGWLSTAAMAASVVAMGVGFFA